MRTIRPAGAPGPAADAARVRALLAAFARRRSLRDPIAASCEDLDLTPVQVHLLLWLGSDGPLTMGDLARRVAVTEKTITGVVDRLERDGLVVRERDPEDRRVVHVRLSAAGEAAHRSVDAGINARLEAALSLLDPADRGALVRILEKLFARLAGAGEAPLPGPRRAAPRRDTKPPHVPRRAPPGRPS